jgi:acyl dehydratase
MRYFEDFREGETVDLGSRHLSAEDAVAFAREYDPQPFHLDEEAARRTVFGGLIASGWQTLAINARLGVDGMMSGTAGLGSPGVEEVRWPKPVRPPVTLRGRSTVLSVKASERNPRRGTIRFLCELLDEDGDVVLRTVIPMFVARRPDSPA